MGLFGKTLGGLASKFKDRISQGIQGAKRFAGNAFNTAKQGLTNAKDFIYDHREAIGGALKAASPFIGAINPALGLAASTGGSFLSNLKPGPVKDKLKKIAHESYDDDSPEARRSRDIPKHNVTVQSNAQQAVERKKQIKKAKRPVQE